MKERTTAFIANQAINDFEIATHRYVARMRHVAQKLLVDPDELAEIVLEVRKSQDELLLLLETLKPFLQGPYLVSCLESKRLVARLNAATAQRELANQIVGQISLY